MGKKVGPKKIHLAAWNIGLPTTNLLKLTLARRKVNIVGLQETEEKRQSW